MRRHAIFSELVHVTGANLHFNRPSIIADDNGVQGFVTIRFRASNVIIEFLRDRLPQVMQHTQHAITIFHIVNDDAKRADVVQICKLQLLATHFIKNAVNVLGAARNLGADVLNFKRPIQSRNGAHDEILALNAFFIQPFRNLFISLGFGKTKSQILQLPFDLPNAQTVGQWRVEQQGLLRHFNGARDFVFCVIT